MRNGLYGKLPSKRDFVAIASPREFLSVWEAWLQGAVSASTLRLGNAWKPAFLKAPIWRFWLGAEICGETTLGAFMPSLDGVGRYFPLTVFVRGEGADLAPPEFEPQTPWFTAAEDYLLLALEESTTFEAFAAGLDRLGPPREGLPPSARRASVTLADGSTLLDAASENFGQVFASARMADHAAAYAGLSFWWTVGGDGFPAVALARRQMPDPFVYTAMITGDFSSLLP